MGDFSFWISLSLSLSLRPNFRTELNPKSEVTFLIWTQPIAQRKFSLGVSLSPNFGLSDSLSKS